MMARLLIAMLVLAGANPLRICTCFAEDEPMLSIPCGDDHPGCHCPILKPVEKLTLAPIAVPADGPCLDCIPAFEPVLIDLDATDPAQLDAHDPPPTTPLYVTLRTLRN